MQTQDKNPTVESDENILAQFSSLLSSVEQSLETFESTSIQLEVMEQSLESAETAIEGNVQFLELFRERISTANEGIMSSSEQVQTLLTTAEEATSQTSQSTLQNLERLKAAVAVENRQFIQNAESLSSQLNELIESADLLDGNLADIAEQSENQFQNLTSSFTDFQQKLEQLIDETVASFTQLANALSQTHPGETQRAFEQFNNQLTQEQLNNMATGFMDLEEQLIALYQQFDLDVDALSDELLQQGSDILYGATEHFRSVLQQEVENVFADAIDGIIAEIFDEVMENVLLMQIGQATTSSISGALPYLAAAKAATGVLRAVDDHLLL